MGIHIDQNIGPHDQQVAMKNSTMCFDEQIGTLKELVDMGASTLAKPEVKKKEVMRLKKRFDYWEVTYAWSNYWRHCRVAL